MLANDVASLNLEVMELRSERLQMMQLMHGMQEQLVALQRTIAELPLAMQGVAHGNGHATVVTLAEHAGAKVTNGNGNGHHPNGNGAAGDGRTPRRLGHQIR
jgi:hypothetical protein